MHDTNNCFLQYFQTLCQKALKLNFMKKFFNETKQAQGGNYYQEDRKPQRDETIKGREKRSNGQQEGNMTE